MNTTKKVNANTKKATTKKGVKFVAPTKKAPSKLTIARKNLVKHWNEENLTPSKICDFFHNSKEVTQKFIDEVNNSFNTSFKISSLNKSLLAFGYSYEKNSVELSDKKQLIIKDRKQFFSPNYMLMLLQRKAKFLNAKSTEFINYSKEMETRKIVRMIEAQAKKELINKLLAENTKK